MVPVKGWNSSNIWKQQQRIKILFNKKLRADTIHRYRWEDNIKIYHQEVGREHGLISLRSEKRQVVGSCECGNETSGNIHFGGISSQA